MFILILKTLKIFNLNFYLILTLSSYFHLTGQNESLNSNKQSNLLNLENNHYPKIRIRLNNGQLLIGNRKIINELNKKREILNRNIVYEFLGIPFAQPPINEKRFQFPFSLEKLLPNDAYDATYLRDSCVQLFDDTFPGFSGSEAWNPPGNVSEDCLYLNIWVPVTLEQDSLLKKLSEKTNLDEIKYIKNGFSFKYNFTSFVEKTSMFWVYGGSYYSGSAGLKLYDGTILSALENVIVVSTNYRLGVFGFLFMNNKRAPGNAGLADQIKAVEWYKENYLKFFGGSMSSLTMFGESAGSVSLHYHLLAEKNHLFNRVIFQSASGYLEYGYRSPEDAQKVSLNFAEKCGCLKKILSDPKLNENLIGKINNKPEKIIRPLKIDQNRIRYLDSMDLNDLNEKIIECLLKQNATFLSQKQFEIEYVNEFLKMHFVPTMDFHNYVRQDPSEFDFQVKKLPHDILAGINQNEGSYFLFYNYNNIFFNLTQFLKKETIYDNNFSTKRLIESMRTKYVSDDDYTEETGEKELNELYYRKYMTCVDSLYSINGKYVAIDNLNDTTVDFDLDSQFNRKLNSPYLAWKKISKMVGDFVFSCPTVKLANKYSNANPQKTFFYKFDKRAKTNPWPEWMGVMHGYEIEYVFGMPWLHANLYDDEDRLISRRMMNYWANFAKTGKL